MHSSTVAQFVQILVKSAQDNFRLFMQCFVLDPVNIILSNEIQVGMQL